MFESGIVEDPVDDNGDLRIIGLLLSCTYLNQRWFRECIEKLLQKTMYELELLQDSVWASS